MDPLILPDLPVPVGALLGALAVPYLACALRIATSPEVTDRGARLARNAPALATLAVTAAWWWPHLADTLPVPGELVALAAPYLLLVSGIGWLMVPRNLSTAHHEAYEKLSTPLALLVIGAGLTVIGSLATPLTRLVLGA